MSRIWSAEYPALIIAVIALVMLGLLLDNWFAASLAVLGVYILWLYRRMAKLERWIRRGTKASQVYDDDGFVGIIVSHLYRQKKVHNQRKKRTKKILGTLNRNISALPDATILLNADREIEWCNEPARYLLSIRSPQDLGYRISNLVRDPDFLAYLDDIDSREHIELVAPRDSGITVQVRIIALGDGQMLIIARNISDQKQLQEGLRNFVANASHELKSPLTVISGELELIEGDPGLSDAGKVSLAGAQRQAERMKQLIQDLLMLSQVESYQLRPDEGDRVSLAEVMSYTSSAMHKYPDHDRIEWLVPDEMTIIGVKAEIEGICVNLVENALKYALPESPIRVRWESNLLGEYLFCVSDEGPGIEAAELARITERYYRGPATSAQVAGSGLGLAIVQQAAHKHGATFEIDSEPGQGSTFRVIFPSYRCVKDERPSADVYRLADY